MEKVKGYKVTDPDMKCRDFQFELNKPFVAEGIIIPCKNGFHFCKEVADCFEYYDFKSTNRVFEVEGEETQEHENKTVCRTITFLREISWEEMLKIANYGKDNTGLKNTGYSNTGNWNTGNSNTGNSNTGYSNTGYSNTGNWNTGYSNTGYSNTGNRNTGNRNTGYSNTGDRNTGAFCTDEPPFTMFNKPSEWTEQDFKNSRAFYLLSNNLETKIWVPDYSMTNEEKEKYPAYKTAGGYVKEIPSQEAFQNMWQNFSDKDKEAFTSLPGFEAAIFEKITGVKVD